MDRVQGVSSAVASPARGSAAAGRSAAAAVGVVDVVRRFGDTEAVSHVSLTIGQREFVSLLGPSGCGKTTLLRMIAGLDRQDEGRIEIDSRDVTRVPAHRRPVNLVFQRYALFPHKTVGDNVAFALELRRLKRAEIEKRVQEMLQLVQLPGYTDRRVDELSGGQAQRVALARALIDDPAVLLLDEPLAALDLKLRQAMQVELRQIQRRVGSTFVYVTHDQHEAFALSDRVVLMDQGRVVQQGPPMDIYRRPANLFAARFLGEANIMSGLARRDGQDTVIDCGSVSLTSSMPVSAGASATACIRPEAIALERPGASGVNCAHGPVTDVAFLGSLVRYRIDVAGSELLCERPSSELESFAPGEIVRAAWRPVDVAILEEPA